MQARRRGGDQVADVAPQIDLIIRDQARTTVDQAKRQIRFAAPRRTAQEYAGAGDGDAGGMYEGHE